MGAILPYMLLAFFVFILVCIGLVLWRYLFAGLKDERLFIELKQAELETLLGIVRKEADDFFDLAAEDKAEIIEERKKIAALVAGLAVPGVTLPIAPEEVPALPDFQTAIDIAAKRQTEPEPEPEKTIEPEVILEISDEALSPAAQLQSRREKIFELTAEGFDRIEIARDLGITLNEVDLELTMK
ncbi:MAG: hypothetical protein LBN97_04475 [Oscillospiraceae bacterium]|jgi:hypothetical protein|nr:hypothetical protein [Oscillospiraceae bacterium]